VAVWRGSVLAATLHRRHLAGYTPPMHHRELRETFHHYDSNHDGRISLVEFSRLLQALGAGMNDEEVRIGFEALDTDGNHGIDFDEFVRWWNDR
jgi:Ca2+-binding EF-hand superfamily protein